MNSIANLKTLHLQSAEGPVNAIVMGLNIRDLETADAFISEAAEKFKLQRMCSPPDMSVLLITVVTEMPAAKFALRWHENETRDPILAFFMSRMKTADVVCGTTVGETLETVSLVATAATSPPSSVPSLPQTP
jgi:hypothetical protein